MKHEPLKNKLHKLAGHPHMEPADNNDVCAWWFHKNDVKSAVNGLKKDIDKFRTKNPCFDAWIYSEIMTLIHKWFEDVI